MSGEKSLLHVWESHINVRTGAKMTTSVSRQNNKQSNETWKLRDLLLSCYSARQGQLERFMLILLRECLDPAFIVLEKHFIAHLEKKKKEMEKRCILIASVHSKSLGHLVNFSFFFFSSSLNLFFVCLESLHILSEVFPRFILKQKAWSYLSWMVKSLARTFSLMSYRNALIRKTPLPFSSEIIHTNWPFPPVAPTGPTC